MSAYEREARREPDSPTSYRYGERQSSGTGWILFAGIIILILGIVNVIGGIAAIDGANFYNSSGVHYQIATLNFWGWVILLIGVMQLGAAFSIWSGNPYGRWVGTLSAGGNAIAQLFLIAAFPLWSMTLIGMDILVIYGLVVYGGQSR